MYKRNNAKSSQDKTKENSLEKGEDMSAVVENIIKKDNEQYEEFYNYQRNKIAELRKMNAAKANGKNVSSTEIEEKLKNAGILDKQGNLASPYSDGE